MEKKLILSIVISSLVLLPGFAFAINLAVIDPPGTNIVDSSGTVYMITMENGQTVRRPYTSAGAFLSYGFNNWAGVDRFSPEDSALPAGSFIPPRDGKIICSDRGSDKGTCYFISNGMKAGFVSESVFAGLGYNFSRAIFGDISFLPSSSNIQSAGETHREGALISLNNTVYALRQNPFTGGTASLEGFADAATFNSWGYSFSDVMPANAADTALPVTKDIVPARVAGQLTLPRPTDFPPPIGQFPLQISNLNPSSGPVGTQVTITGNGFTVNNNTVIFGEGSNIGSASFSGLTSSNGTSLQFTIPSHPSIICLQSPAPNSITNCDPIPFYAPGNYNVRVSNTNGASNSQIFTFTVGQVSAPVITSLNPASGPSGTQVTITGSGFTAAGNIVSLGSNAPKVSNLISANGKTLQFTIPATSSPNCQIGMPCPLAIVPIFSVDYPVAVTNANGTSNSQTFTVTGQICPYIIDCPAPPQGYNYQRTPGSCNCGVLTLVPTQ